MTGKAVLSQNLVGGVTALVCACCGQVVGMVNVVDAFRMIKEDESYICKACMGQPEEQIEQTLAAGDTDFLWTTAMLDGLMEAQHGA